MGISQAINSRSLIVLFAVLALSLAVVAAFFSQQEKGGDAVDMARGIASPQVAAVMPEEAAPPAAAPAGFTAVEPVRAENSAVPKSRAKPTVSTRDEARHARSFARAFDLDGAFAGREALRDDLAASPAEKQPADAAVAVADATTAHAPAQAQTQDLAIPDELSLPQDGSPLELVAAPSQADDGASAAGAPRIGYAGTPLGDAELAAVGAAPLQPSATVAMASPLS